jgi:hypothetical protein
MARPAGVEPTTYGFGDRHSIQLSYGRVTCGVAVAGPGRRDPVWTPGLSGPEL